MTLTINDTIMTSDQTAHTARLAPGSQHLWEVSWLPGRAVDRNSAITAMTLADLTSCSATFSVSGAASLAVSVCATAETPPGGAWRGLLFMVSAGCSFC
jgi:hypothetical protein